MVTSVATRPGQSVKPGKVSHRPRKVASLAEHKAGNWPLNITQAYALYSGPYTALNAATLLEEEPLELYNGWLVWQDMTEPEERRIAANIQAILDLAARAAGFGQAFPDQLECKMVSGNVVKPDVCLLSIARFNTEVVALDPKKEHLVLGGGPELVVEIRSPSNTRPEERRKRQGYFESGTLVVWDVEPKKHKIWVYEVAQPEVGREYKVGEEISCEQLLPGWKRKVADFFRRDLTAEQIVGEEAVKWRAESEQKGRIEGQAEGEQKGRAEGELLTLRQIVLLQASSRFPTLNASDLETRLAGYNVEQLTLLATSLVTNVDLEQWLATLPDS